MRKLATWLTLFALTGGVGAQLEPVGSLFGPVSVLTVIDGDTLVLESNLGPRTVRLIGIDAPETSHPERGRDPYGPEARAFVAALLPEGTPVWVELDLGVNDAFGRLLAYLYVEDPDGTWVVEGRPAAQVNLAIAEAGFATELTIEPNSTYADLYRDSVASAREAGRGMWAPGEAATDHLAALPEGPIVIHCALYDPATPNDEDGEWVSLLIREPVDTRGYYLYDEGSRSTFRLPPGIQEPGALRVGNPGQGVWNNGGDVIYLKRGDAIVDQWDYRDRLAPEGVVICRDEE
ncbi:MAG: thermonuclease family protein [Trueperaceae bacterium]